MKGLSCKFILTMVCLSIILIIGLRWKAQSGDKKCGKDFLLCNTNICSSLRKDGMLLYIYNSMDGKNTRNIIRSTFGSQTLINVLNIKIMFVMGVTENVTSLPPNILEEFVQYGDILVVNVLESYKNLTLKGTKTLQFLADHCKQATWVMKADDDVFLDLQRVRDRLNRWKSNNPSPPIFGFFLPHHRPAICPKYPKWCIDKSVNIKRYPPYVVGVGYIFSYKLVSKMIAEIIETKQYMNLTDDVYMTGYLTKNINKQIVDWHNYIIKLPTTLSGYKKRRAIIAHLKHSNLSRQIWLDLYSSKNNTSIKHTQKY